MMSKIKKIPVIYALCAVLCGCSFAPMHSTSPRGGQDAATRDIFIAPISGTNGIDMRNALRAKFGTDNNPTAKYSLQVNLQSPATIYKALQATGDATWQEVRLVATYVLKQSGEDEEILHATDTAAESYTFVRDLVAAQASYNNAVQSAIRVLSEKIELRVIAKLSEL